jgi:hypothetical protein
MLNLPVSEDEAGEEPGKVSSKYYRFSEAEGEPRRNPARVLPIDESPL